MSDAFTLVLCNLRDFACLSTSRCTLVGGATATAADINTAGVVLLLLLLLRTTPTTATTSAALDTTAATTNTTLTTSTVLL